MLAAVVVGCSLEMRLCETVGMGWRRFSESEKNTGRSVDRMKTDFLCRKRHENAAFQILEFCRKTVL